jgi:hypothetical protein
MQFNCVHKPTIETVVFFSYFVKVYNALHNFSNKTKNKKKLTYNNMTYMHTYENEWHKHMLSMTKLDKLMLKIENKQKSIQT